MTAMVVPSSQRGRRRFALLVAAALSGAGCAEMRANAPELFKRALPELFYEDARDACSTHRLPLTERLKETRNAVLAGAAVGAITVGFFAALAASGNHRAAVAALAAVGGAVAGGTLGYLDKRRQQARDENELRALVAGDVRDDQLAISRLARALDNLNGCRQREIAAAEEALLLSGGGTPADRDRVTELRERLREDDELVRLTVGELGARYRAYADATATLGGRSTDAVLGRAATFAPAVSGERRPQPGRSGPGPSPGPGAELRAAREAVAVRSQPSGSILGQLATGERVWTTPSRFQGNWQLVHWQGREGWVPARYLVTPDRARPKLPTVRRDKAPKPQNDVQGLAIQTRITEAEYQAQKTALEAELDALDALLA
jgi:hypothetical protein